MLKLRPYLFILVISVFFYSFTFRGQIGNPTPVQIDSALKVAGQPFETSQERSRWALILSLYNQHSFIIDKYAGMGISDVGYIKGHYYSFFPPGLSLLALPLFAIGQHLRIAQLATFSISTIFAILTQLLILKFCRRLDLPWTISLFIALSFAFATNAWGYSVTLYAHLVSAFLLLFGLYLSMFFKPISWLTALVVWLLYGFAILTDFPNLFLYFPVIIILNSSIVTFHHRDSRLHVLLNPKLLLSPLIFIAFIGLYGYYNFIHFGSPTILSNTLPRVHNLKQIESPTNRPLPVSGEVAAKVLYPRTLINGFSTFLFSRDRGLMYFSPLVLLFVVGLFASRSSPSSLGVKLISIPSLCLVLYSMFGDPYGGWAFGSRYLIACLPQLLILAGLGLRRYAFSRVLKIIYLILFGYSSAVSLLAPLTTNAIPPYIEAQHLVSTQSTYLLNWRMLQNNQLNSFFFNSVFYKNVSGQTYYFGILIPLIILGGILIFKTKSSYDT